MWFLSLSSFGCYAGVEGITGFRCLVRWSAHCGCLLALLSNSAVGILVGSSCKVIESRPA